MSRMTATVRGVNLFALLELCTGAPADTWRVETEAPGRITFSRGDRDPEDEMTALFASDDRRWYLAVIYVEGGCEVRLAHGVHDGAPARLRLREDCKQWPVLDRTAWRSCCDRVSRGTDDGRL